VIPSPEEIEGRKSEQLLGKVRGLLETGSFAPQESLVECLLEEGFQSIDISSVLLAMLLGQTGGGVGTSPASDSSEPAHAQKPSRREEYGPATDEELGEFGRRPRRHGNGPSTSSPGKPHFKKKGFKKGAAKTFRKYPRSN
jgi:hypothetical protein